MKNLLIVFVVLQSWFVFSQTNSEALLQIKSVDGANPWTNLNLNNDSDKFHFAIVTDRTGGHRPGVFENAITKLNLLQPEFVMSVGDLIEGYTENLNVLNHEWDEFDSFVKQLEMPFFYVPGNHDITNQVMEDLWKKRLGNTYYYFIYKDVLFLALNSEDQKRGSGKGTISDEQFEFVKKTLQDHPDVNWTLLFMHQPLWNQKDTKRWNEIEQLLSERKHTVFTGHEHHYVKYQRNNANYYILATTGGSSRLRGPKMGEFDHVVWITMTKNGPIMANLLLDGIYDDAVFNEKMRNHVEDFSKNNPIKITPFYTDSENFKEGEIEIKITNDENIPMMVSFDEQSSLDLIGIVERKSITVPPNSVEKLKMKIIKRFSSNDDPLTLSAKVIYQPEDVPAGISFPYQFQIKPLPKLKFEETKKPIIIDGNQKDWKHLPYSYKGENAEVRMNFNIAYDANYVYFGAMVYDIEVNTYGSGAVWTQDNIALLISPYKLAQSAMSMGENWYDNDFIKGISPSTATVASVIYKGLEKDNEAVSKVVEGGYFTEMRVPIQYIVDKQGKDWNTLRINVMWDDKDGDTITRHYWQPDWRNAKENIIGSGMFFRVGSKN